MKQRNNILSRILSCIFFLAFVIFASRTCIVKAYEQDNDISSSIFINEICAKNESIAAPDGNYYDWIELFNSGEMAVDISGYGLSDKEKKPYKFIFPEGTIIEAGEYLLVYCDVPYANESIFTTSFGLSTSGETVFLSDRDGGNGIIDQIQFSDLKSDVSYGRVQRKTAPYTADDYAQYKGARAYFDKMSPGARNELEFVRVTAPVFSMESGLYDEPFDLELFAEEESEIHYTTDCSTPTENSPIYNGSIHIYDRSNESNDISTFTNISTRSTVQAPTESVNKAFVVRAMAVSTSTGKKSSVITNTYFVDYNSKNNYFPELPIYSLATDIDNLFSDDKGIYVLGDTYNEWRNGTNYNPLMAWQIQPANYRNKGMGWEIPTNLTIINKSALGLNQDIGVRIHGGYSRAFPQKSLSLFARSKYGVSKLSVDPYRDGNVDYMENTIDEYDSIMVRNGGNDYKTLRFREKINQRALINRSILTQAMTPCVLYLNGEYWGQYEITERISAEMVSSHFGVDEDAVCLIKVKSLEDGDEQGFQEWKELFTWVKSQADFSSISDYERIQREIDLNSYIDYVCGEIYLANTDWVNNNVAWWKCTYEDKDHEYADGKWRFILYDTDITDSKKSYDTFTEKLNMNDQFISELFKKLILNDDFRQRFTIAFMDIANDNFDYNTICGWIDEYASDYEKYTIDYYKRFESQTTLTPEAYQSKVDDLKTFFRERRGYASGHLKEALNLSGDLIDVIIPVNPSQGEVYLNTIGAIAENRGAEGTWTGQYFTDFPIHVTAEPEDGYIFSHFSLSDGRVFEEDDVEIPLTENVTITPVFQEITEEFLAGKPYLIENKKLSYDVDVPHVVINQLYGAGNKGKDAYVSHSFIELYNPTDVDVDLSKWQLCYKSSPDGKQDGAWVRHSLSGSVKAHSSYLVRCKANTPVADEEFSVSIQDYDEEWSTLAINNKGAVVLLISNQRDVTQADVYDNDQHKPLISNYVDMLAVGGNDVDDEAVMLKEAPPVYEGVFARVQSKKKTVRRRCFADSDNNGLWVDDVEGSAGDLEEVDYSFVNEGYIAYIRPRCGSEGVWENGTYPSVNVTLEVGGGVGMDPIAIPCRENLTTVGEVEREGYTFTGWFTDEGCTEALVLPVKHPVNDFKLYAGWTVNNYKLSFVTNGGEAVEPVSYDYGAVVQKPEETTKEGYSFTGWFEDEGLTKAYALETMPAKDVKLYAGWTVNNYKLSFVTNGGEVVEPVSYEYGAVVQKPGDAVRQGYSFTGWFEDKGLTKAYAFETMPAKDVELYAGWRSVDVTGIALDADISVVLGTAVKLNVRVLPDNARIRSVTYVSNDDSVASVTDEGVVTGNKLGETTITVSATDGSGVNAVCKVFVIATEGDIRVTPGDVIVKPEKKTEQISVSLDPDNKDSVISIPVTYMNAVTFTGGKIDPRKQLGAKVDTTEITDRVTLNADTKLTKVNLLLITYISGNKAAGEAEYYAKITINETAKKAMTADEFNKLKDVVKAVNEALKANPCKYTINKASIADLAPEVHATLKKKKIQVKNDKLKKLKSVKVLLNGKKTKLNKKDYIISDPDKSTNTVKLTGTGNYTGTVVVTVRK